MPFSVVCWKILQQVHIAREKFPIIYGNFYDAGHKKTGGWDPQSTFIHGSFFHRRLYTLPGLFVFSYMIKYTGARSLNEWQCLDIQLVHPRSSSIIGHQGDMPSSHDQHALRQRYQLPGLYTICVMQWYVENEITSHSESHLAWLWNPSSSVKRHFDTRKINKTINNYKTIKQNTWPYVLSFR